MFRNCELNRFNISISCGDFHIEGPELFIIDLGWVQHPGFEFWAPRKIGSQCRWWFRYPKQPGMYQNPVNNGIRHLSTGAGFLLSTVCPKWNGESFFGTIILPESLKLTVCTWKLMVGRQAFPVGMAYFPGRDASFRECKCRIAKHKESNRIW